MIITPVTYKNLQTLNYINKNKEVSFKQANAGHIEKMVTSRGSFLESALSKLKKINLAEYKTLTQEEIQALRAEISNIKNLNTSVKILNEDIRTHQYAAEAIRQCFDKEFGVGKYVVIAIGRSLSSISKLLGMKIGEQNVKNIPMSNLTLMPPRTSNQILYWGNESEIDLYRRYLNSIGLSKSVVEKSNKQYLIMDYSYTGKSLINAYKILTSNSLLGNKKRNISIVSIQEVLPQNYGVERMNLMMDLRKSSYKPYSLVGKLDCPSSQNLSRALDYEQFCVSDYQLRIHKLFGFGLIDSEYSLRGSQPYLDMEFSSYPRAYSGQNKRFWLTEAAQFKNDLYEDELELTKAINQIQSGSRIQEELLELKGEIRKNPPPIFYYNTLRPRILKALSQI